MTLRALSLLLGAAALGTTLLVSSDGRAGATWSGYGCSSYAAGGYCFGTFAAVRNAPNTTDYAQFVVSGGPTPSYSFSAFTGGQWYLCNVAATSPLAGMASQVASSRGYYYVAWNSSSTCTVVEVANSSEYAGW